MALSLLDTNGPIRRSYEEFNLKDWNIAEEGDRADASMYLLKHIDKGEFAQALAADWLRMTKL